MPKIEFKTPEAQAHYQKLVDQHGKNAVHDLLRIPEDANKVVVQHGSINPNEEALRAISWTWNHDGTQTHNTTTEWHPNNTVHNVLNHSAGNPPGHGTKVLARQVLAARKIGVPSLHIETAMSDKGRGSIGGYVWPRLGFNGPIRVIAKRHFPDHKDMHSIFSDEAAIKKWKDLHMSTFYLSFDVHPDSEHSKRLLAYMKAKGIKV